MSPTRAKAAALALASLLGATGCTLRAPAAGEPDRRGGGEVASQREPGALSLAVRKDVTRRGVAAHLAAFQAIARRNGGNRAAGTEGYDDSARYVYEQLRAAGYDVRYQEFAFGAYVERVERAREVRPTARVLAVDAMEYSPSTPRRGLTAELAVVPLDADGSHGCEAGDYEGRPFRGRIALVKRGTCAFADKAKTASSAGAVAAIVYSDLEEGFEGTLGGPEEASIPTVSVTRAAGEALAADAAGGREVVVSLNVQSTTEETSRNVIAEIGGRADGPVVMAGGHLDSVDEGPGLNDNASGSAALVEVARQLAKTRPRTKVRFAFWGAEEVGLIGSRYYARRLRAAEVRRILVYLNFDMVGSPNFGRFVYTRGDVRSGAKRAAETIGRIFLDYFRARGLPAERLEYGGGSDHTSLAAVGVPTGGLFTGASATKTAREARLFGGDAGKPYDACYHQACDTRANVDLAVLHEMADAAAHAVATFATEPALVRGR